MRSVRAEFSKAVKEAAWARAKGRCEHCSCGFGGRRPEYQHVIPAALGGPATLDNCLCLCPPCHRYITKTEDLPRIVKAKALEEKRAGLRRSKAQWPKPKRVGWGWAR